jgi:hypothetical protein
MKKKPRRLEKALEDALTRRPVDTPLPRGRLPVRGLVDADVIAARLGVTEEHVRRRWKQYPFARRISTRVIRYDPVAFDAYLDQLAQDR